MIKPEDLSQYFTDYGDKSLSSVKMDFSSNFNGAMGSIGAILENHINFTISVYHESSTKEMIRKYFNMSGAIVFAEGFFTVEDHEIKGNIVLLFEALSMDALLAAINNTES